MAVLNAINFGADDSILRCPAENKPLCCFSLDFVMHDSGLIHAGVVPLNQVSSYLDGQIPDEATAELHWVPENLADIDGKGCSTWSNSLERMGDVKDYHGFYTLPFFPFSKEDFQYERMVANAIKRVFRKAVSYHKNVTTGLFIPTDSLLCGRKPVLEDGGKDQPSVEVVENNLCSMQDEIGRQGKPLTTEPQISDFSHLFLSASQDKEGCTRAVDLLSEEDNVTSCLVPKDTKVSVRLAALTINPL